VLPFLTIAVAIYAAGAGVIQTAPDPIPFRVVGSSGIEVRVDIGAQRDQARSLRRATVLTAAGAVAAAFARTERTCEKLCAGTTEECHFEAVLRAAAPVDGAVAVLPGAHEVRDVRPIEAGASERVVSDEEWIEAGPVTTTSGAHRWTRFPGKGVYLTSEQHGHDYMDVALDRCTASRVGPFTRLACGAAELLYDGHEGIALSIADYGTPITEPLIRFQLGGRDAVVLRLGLKAEIATALLIKEDGRWRLYYRRADYALLC
jgi:hypothetical protein